jgi:DNA-binding GntR family transcriptional regulator
MFRLKTHREAASEWIRNGILDGRYQRGQRLKQQELSQELGCSVIPVREALHQLAAEGLVVLHPQRGAWVADLDSRQLGEIYEVRICLETWAVVLAARGMTSEAAERIRTILDKMDHPDISVDEWVRLNWEFHDSIYASSGQKYLREMISNLRLSVECYLRLDLAKVGDFASGRREHHLIFQACLRRDARAAKRYTAAHLRRVSQGVMRYLEQHRK